MKKKTLFLDSLAATSFILFVIWILSKIPFSSDIVNPISKAFGDFQLTDIVFSHLRENPDLDTNVVLVNIGDLPRDGIAAEIEILNKYQPRAIGIDAFFRKPKENVEADSALSRAFSRTKNLVLVSKVNRYNEGKDYFDTLEISHPIFSQYANSGMSNMISEGYDKFKTSRDFSPYEKYLDKTYINDTIRKADSSFTIIQRKVKEEVKDELAFAVKLAQFKDPEAVKKLLARGNETETINYRGNFNAGQQSTDNANLKYFALDIKDVFNPDIDLSFIKDKIIVMGYMGPSFDKVTWEDKFFTPLNPVYIGKANPDMYGMVIHANIISMILNQDYIESVPFYIELIFSVIIIFLNVWLFSYMYFKLELWYDGASNALTLMEIMVLMIIVLVIFNYYGYKVDITLPSVALFLTGNLVEIHFGIIKPTFLKLLKKIS